MLMLADQQQVLVQMILMGQIKPCLMVVKIKSNCITEVLEF